MGTPAVYNWLHITGCINCVIKNKQANHIAIIKIKKISLQHVTHQSTSNGGSKGGQRGKCPGRRDLGAQKFRIIFKYWSLRFETSWNTSRTEVGNLFHWSRFENSKIRSLCRGDRQSRGGGEEEEGGNCAQVAGLWSRNMSTQIPNLMLTEVRPCVD